MNSVTPHIQNVNAFHRASLAPSMRNNLAVADSLIVALRLALAEAELIREEMIQVPPRMDVAHNNVTQISMNEGTAR